MKAKKLTELKPANPREWTLSAHAGSHTPIVWDGPLIDNPGPKRPKIRVREIIEP